MRSSGSLHDTPPAMMSDHLIRHTTLRQLQIFEASVRFGSFTRAAEALFLTQPTVSMQIKKLADTVGLPLFEQVGRKLRPTEAGTELYKSCRQIFATLSNLEMKMADLKGIKTGRLTLGVITTANCFAPEVLGEFCQLYQGIEVALNVFNRDQIIDRIKNNEDDLYIMGQAPVEQTDDIEAFPFAPNPLVVLAPRDHPLVGQTNIPLVTHRRGAADSARAGIRDTRRDAAPFRSAGPKPQGADGTGQQRGDQARHRRRSRSFSTVIACTGVGGT